MNRLIVTGAPYPLSPPPFAAMDSWEGDRMPDPVDAPDPGIEDVSVRELAARAGTLRDPDAGAVFSDGRPRALRIDQGTPPAVAPAGVPRRGRHPLLNWPAPRQINDFNPHGVHSHGALTPGAAAQPAGGTGPGISLRRNTFRLSPEPWDAVQMIERPTR